MSDQSRYRIVWEGEAEPVLVLGWPNVQQSIEARLGHRVWLGDFRDGTALFWECKEAARRDVVNGGLREDERLGRIYKVPA